MGPLPGSPLDQWMAMAELYRTMMGTPGGPGAPANSVQWAEGMAPSPASLCSSRLGSARKTEPGKSLLKPCECQGPGEEADQACPMQLRSLGHPHPHVPSSRAGEVYWVMPERSPEQSQQDRVPCSSPEHIRGGQWTIHIALWCLSFPICMFPWNIRPEGMSWG